MIYELARPREGKAPRLRQASVGFRVKDWTYEERGGFNILAYEGLEWSIVPIASNREALSEAKAAGIDVTPMKEWAAGILDSVSGPGLWFPRAAAEAILKAIPAGGRKRGRTLSSKDEESLRSARSLLDQAPSPELKDPPQAFSVDTNQVMADLAASMTKLAETRVRRAFGRLD
jgi:hypothetical protein